MVLVLRSSSSDEGDAAPVLNFPSGGRGKPPALRDLHDTILRRADTGSQDRKTTQDRAQQPTVLL